MSGEGTNNDINSNAVELSARIRVLEDALQRQQEDQARREHNLRQEVELLEEQLVSLTRRAILYSSDTTNSPTSRKPGDGVECDDDEAFPSMNAFLGHNGGATDGDGKHRQVSYLRRKEMDVEAAMVKLSAREEALATKEAQLQNKETRLEQWQEKLQQEADNLQDRIRDLEQSLGAREDRLVEAEGILKDKISRFESNRNSFLQDKEKTSALQQQWGQRVQRKEAQMLQMAAAMSTTNTGGDAAAAAGSGSPTSNGANRHISNANGTTTSTTAGHDSSDVELKALDSELTHISKEIKALHARQVAANAKRAFLARKVKR